MSGLSERRHADEQRSGNEEEGEFHEGGKRAQIPGDLLNPHHMTKPDRFFSKNCAGLECTPATLSKSAKRSAPRDFTPQSWRPASRLFFGAVPA
jgi:hypothetical protein